MLDIKKVIAICVMLFLLLVSCKTNEIVREIPIPIEHTTENVRVDIIRDTLFRHDSVTTYIKGDTTIIEKWHTLQNVNHYTKADTVVEYREKPVTVTQTVTKEVNVLKWWQKCLMWAGGILLSIIVVMGIIVARRISNIK